MNTFVIVVSLAYLAIAAGKYCDRKDLDCPGHDIRSFKGNLATCKTACNGDKDCRSIQNLNGHCWLKRHVCQNGELNQLIGGTDAVKVGSSDSCTEYARPWSKFCLRDGMDCGGHDIKALSVNMEMCKKFCDYDTACVTFQILENKRCWLKRHRCTNNELKPLKNGKDYVKLGKAESCTPYKKSTAFKYCLRDNTDCAGHDIRHINWITSAKQCRDFCDWDADCKSIQVIGTSCWLKRHACANNELRPWQGGKDQVKTRKSDSCDKYKPFYKYRFCERANKDCPGHDIVSTQVPTIKECFHLCSYKDECKSIQYIGTTCWLKRRVCSSGQLRNWDHGRDHIRIVKSEACVTALKDLDH